MAFLSPVFFLSLPLWGQSPGVGNYVIEQRYVQHLVWNGDNYTLKYEVVIEQKKGKVYSEYMREFTDKPGLQVLLPSGNFRYRIIPYDFLEQPGEMSAWVEIDIKPAPIIHVEIQKAEDGSYVLSPFDNEQIVPGVNEIVIKNPDEIEISGTSETRGLFNIYFSAAWSPTIPLFGRIQEIFENDFYTAGAIIRFGLLYNKLKWFNPGLELSASWYALSKDHDNDTIGIQTGITGFNIVAQKMLLNHKMAVTLRAGCALAFQVGEINVEQYSYSTGGLMTQLNFEASFLWFAFKQLYLESGVSFTYLINQNSNSACLRPWLGLGWQF